MNSKYFNIFEMLKSRGLVAFSIVFGLFFMQTTFYFLGVPWSKTATIIFYSVTFLWVMVCTLSLREMIQRFNLIDACYLFFVSVVFLSLYNSSQNRGFDYRIWSFFMLMVIVPYISGRCIGDRENLDVFRKIILFAGLIIMPLLVVDRLLFQIIEHGRTAFFGMNHSPLMIGALLTAALICLQSYVLSSGMFGHVQSRIMKFTGYALLCIMTGCLIWVSARGWLVAWIVGALAMTWMVKRVKLSKRITVMLVIILTTASFVKFIHFIDPDFGAVYLIAGDALNVDSYFKLEEAGSVLVAATPVLGQASCAPLKIGVDSIAIRWVLYQEAIHMFLQKPLYGVGAGAFGWYSCLGFDGYPHSTGLQVISELGVLGGVIFVVLIALSGVTFIREIRGVQSVNEMLVTTFLASLFVSVCVADQIYGNFFMALAFWLLIGISASIRGDSCLRNRVNV